MTPGMVSNHTIHKKAAKLFLYVALEQRRHPHWYCLLEMVEELC